MRSREAKYQLVVPRGHVMVARQAIARAWPEADAAPGDDVMPSAPPTEGVRLGLRRHFVFGLGGSRSFPDALLEVLHALQDDECVAVQIVLSPAPRDWWEVGKEAYGAVQQGKMPRRLEVSPRLLIQATAGAVLGVAGEVLTIVQDLLEVPDGDRVKCTADEPMDLPGRREGRDFSTQTRSKLKWDGFDVAVRVAAWGRGGLARLAAGAFSSVDGDNSLEVVAGLDAARFRRRQGALKVNRDYLSVPEVARLMELPSRSAQERYGVASVRHRRGDVPTILRQGGMHLGKRRSGGFVEDVWLPTADPDAVSLGHVVTGMMGSGKTTFAARWAIEAVRSGMGAVVMDPQRGHAGDAIERALSPDQVVRLRFGQHAYSIDWREALHAPGPSGRSRLAEELVEFVDLTDAPQSGRFLSSAGKVAPDVTLDSILRVFRDADLRAKLRPRMSPYDRQVWDEYDAASEQRRAQLQTPVLNHLDRFMRDAYLAECAENGTPLDFVDLIDAGPRAIICDIPQSLLGRLGTDLLGAWLVGKLNLAARYRGTEHIVHVIQDEPHQYIRTAGLWDRVAVESRQWRFSYSWLFHTWEQLPQKTREIIRASGPHLHLFRSSEKTWLDFAADIRPWTVEEAMRIPKHQALNVLQVDGCHAPILLEMDGPP